MRNENALLDEKNYGLLPAFAVAYRFSSAAENCTASAADTSRDPAARCRRRRRRRFRILRQASSL